MTQDIFTNQGDLPQIDPNADPLELLTAPGGKFDRTKYATEADMYRAIAKGKVEGDMYIDHFKKRHDELREDYTKLRDEYNAGPSLKELVTKLASEKQGTQIETPVIPDTKAVESVDIDKLVESKLAAAKQRDKEDENFRRVQARLQEQYGPDYARSLKSQIDSLGLTPDFVNDLARKHPEVLYRTLGMEGQRQKEAFQSPPQNVRRTDPFAPNANKRTWSYYQDIRKRDPDAYRSPKIQDQMFKDAAELGEAFQDGDWNTVGHR